MHNNALDRSRSTDAKLAGCSLRDIISRSNTCELYDGSVNLVVIGIVAHFSNDAIIQT